MMIFCEFHSGNNRAKDVVMTTELSNAFVFYVQYLNDSSTEENISTTKRNCALSDEILQLCKHSKHIKNIKSLRGLPQESKVFEEHQPSDDIILPSTVIYFLV